MKRLLPRQIGSLLRQHGPALLAYLVLTILFTYPLLWRLHSAIAGEHVPDTMQNYWNLWWTGHALLELHQNPYHADYIQHPFGLLLLFHTYNFLGNLLSLPLQLCCGPTAAYNLMFIVSFVLAGAGTYGLVYYLTGQRWAAFIAGLIYAFSPYMAYHLKAGQPFMVATHWFPFYLWLLLLGLRSRWGYLWLAGVLLLLIGLTDWHYTVYALLLTALVGLYEIGQRWRAEGGLTAAPALIGRLALVGGVFTVGMLPVLVPMFVELAQEEYATRDLRHSIYHSVDVLAFVTPSLFHPLWGEWANTIYTGRLVEPFIAGGIASLGALPLLLGVCGLLGSWRRSALYGLLFAVFCVLALGPYLRVNGWQSADSATPIPLPYLLFRALPFMDIHRIPSRFVAVAMLALAVLAGFGVTWLVERPWLQRRSIWLSRGLLVGLALLVLFEYWPRPFGMTPAGPDTLPPYYQQLSAANDASNTPSDGAILEIPDLDARSMYYQTYHQHPIMGGQISRPKGHLWRRARFFGALLQVQPGWDDVGQDNSAAAVRAALACQDVQQVVVYKDEPGEATRSRVRRLERDLFGDVEPTYEDAVMRVYTVANTYPDVPYWTPDPNEWHPPERIPELNVTSRWAIEESASLQIYPCGQERVQVQFDIFSYSTERTIELWLNGEPISSFELPLGWVRQVRMVLPLEPGINQLELRSAEPAVVATTALQAVQNASDSDRADAEPRTISFNLSRLSIIAYEGE